MAEAFELVRTIRQHLRRSAALLEERKFDEALAEANSALALDPQSLSACALRDRIGIARAAATPSSSREPSRSFVPYGVNAASWRGFEQRITERRFKALLETINTSIVAADAIAARTALDEARELRPNAPELADFEARVTAVPVIAAVGAKPSARIWMRAMGAAALFLVGVSLMLGVEWLRPPATSALPQPSIAAPALPAATQVQQPPASAPSLGSVPVALKDEEDESVPAIITPPEPLIRPEATTGTTPTIIASRPVALRDVAPPAIQRMATPARRPVESAPPTQAPAETPNEYVATRATAAANMDAGPAVGPSSAMIDTPIPADARDRATPPPPELASAVTIPAGPDQHLRVEEVLRRYARAYGQLDASAARAVWPSVNERALARAFQNLSSQKVSFDDCQIDIHGVTANASCHGFASYEPKVGKREQRTEPRTWRFALRRDGDAWTIADVDMQRAATANYR